MPTFYVIRHEQPELAGRFLGRTDPPLTEAGRAALAKLAHLDVRVVYSSPRQRARATAAAVPCASEPIIVPELAEIDFGDWEGLTWAEVQERWPELAARQAADWHAQPPPGGEHWIDFSARVNLALDRILSGPAPAAIVAHFAVNCVIAERLLGIHRRDFHQKYGEILTCEYSLDAR